MGAGCTNFCPVVYMPPQEAYHAQAVVLPAACQKVFVL